MSRSQPPSSLPSSSSHVGAALTDHGPTPSTITRSMSRRTLVSSRPTSSTPAAAASNTKLPRARPSLDLTSNISATPSSKSTLPRVRTSSSLSSRAPTVTSGKTSSTTTTGARRRVLGDANASGSATPSELGMLSRKVGRTEAAAMLGMGVVRTGPAVKAQRSPKKLVEHVVEGSSSFVVPALPTSRNLTKRPVTDRSHVEARETEEDNPLRKRVVAPLPSPEKRAHLTAPEDDFAPRSPGPFDLTSPKKKQATAPPLDRNPSPARRRLFGVGDGASAGVPLQLSPRVRRHGEDQNDDMDLDSLPVLPSSPFPHARSPHDLVGGSTKKHGAPEDSSEDELDCLSPRKKKKATNLVDHQSRPTSVLSSMPRSPPKKKASTTLSRNGPTSVPMVRSTGFGLGPPPFRTNALSSVEPPTIDPQLLAQAHLAPLPRTATATGLTSKYAPRKHNLTASSTSTLGLGPAPSTSKASLAPQQQQQPTWRANSHIPRPTGTRTAVDEDSSMSELGGGEPSRSMFSEPSHETLPTTDEGEGDVSMMSVGNTSIGNTSMSDETASRLANLQNMLSRLKMPRQSLGGGTTAPLKEKKTLTGAYREEYSVPLAPADDSVPSHVAAPATSTRSSIPRSRASLSNVPSSTSTAQDLSQSGLGVSRRRHSISSRPSAPPSRAAGGIVNTSSTSSGPLFNNSSKPVGQQQQQQPQQQSNVRSARRVSGAVPTSASTATIAAIADGEMSGEPQSDVLNGVVAFVDVRTLEGGDAGMIFTDMLKNLGARVTTRPTASLTHIIFKSGRPGTLSHWRTQPEPRPHLVGISWVVRCAELNQHVEEKGYGVEAGKEPSFQKRRRSMEPKALAALSAVGGGGGLSGTSATDPAIKATIAASIERARRKSLQFAPKVGSPLAKRVFVMPTEVDEDEEEATDEFAMRRR